MSVDDDEPDLDRTLRQYEAHQLGDVGSSCMSCGDTWPCAPVLAATDKLRQRRERHPYLITDPRSTT
jgi:hypothetical protein